MRVKVECAPPLPSTKAWFIIPPVSTICDLKAALCSELPALHGQTSADEVTLFLDGFELLDASPMDVVRDGDLITYAEPIAILSDFDKDSHNSRIEFV